MILAWASPFNNLRMFITAYLSLMLLPFKHVRMRVSAYYALLFGLHTYIWLIFILSFNMLDAAVYFIEFAYTLHRLPQ